jgi:hypothetical protein
VAWLKTTKFIFLNESLFVNSKALFLFFSDTDVLDKLAFVEAQQRYQTQLLNHILLALQNTDHANESCELPDGISLPIQTLGELADVEKALDIGQNAKKMVNIFEYEYS